MRVRGGVVEGIHLHSLHALHVIIQSLFTRMELFQYRGAQFMRNKTDGHINRHMHIA